MHTRRKFVKQMAISSTGIAAGLAGSLGNPLFADLVVETPQRDESLPEYVIRKHGSFNNKLYCQLLGAANEFKEGDQIIGVAAADEASRNNARQLLAKTKLVDIDKLAPHRDELFQFADAARATSEDERHKSWTIGELKNALLTLPEESIKRIALALSSDVIGCVVKLMSNEELIAVGSKVFNPLPGSKIGSKGYLGARVQPNSPTDHPDDIRWQVFDAFSYAVGDVLVGTNPVSSTTESVEQIERCLQDILKTFEIDDLMPHCVLSHIDVQAKVERKSAGATELWFQSIGGTDNANGTFDLTNEKMKQHAKTRNGRFGLYFETGQGADFTNGHGHGFDMVLHESRKYGFARALTKIVQTASPNGNAWVHLNDVAGFIGPEVFRTREQLVRCCLEDIVMGKLHGLCIGLDVCSTLHMDVSLEDLDWCLTEITPANPAYLMALPTKIDPMLGYLTTGYQDHVRLRNKFGFRVNDPMWAFFQKLGVIDEKGNPTEHFGDPTWVYLQYCREKNDDRSDKDIVAEGKQKINEVRERGLFIAERHGAETHSLEPKLAAEVQRIYEDGKQSIWAELTPQFVRTVPDRFDVTTRSVKREDYILHPDSGEQLSEESLKSLGKLKRDHGDVFDLQIVVSDGLNAHSIMDKGHLIPFLDRLRAELKSEAFKAATENILVTSGRVRTGYRIGEVLFADASKRCSLLHIIGERPGTGHHTFSVYITSALGSDWKVADQVDHNITKVVSGIANTALLPENGAVETVRLLKELV